MQLIMFTLQVAYLPQAGDAGLQDWFIYPVDYCKQISVEILMVLISISVLTGGLIKQLECSI